MNAHSRPAITGAHMSRGHTRVRENMESANLARGFPVGIDLSAQPDATMVPAPRGARWRRPRRPAPRERTMLMNAPSGAAVDLETIQAVQSTPPTSIEDVRERVHKLGVEFLFAQFVDMHGKPNAKLVPATHLDGLFTDGAGF